MAFVATHAIGNQGAASWPAPDAAGPEGPRLDPWLPVQVLQFWGDWAQVRCANGWEAWTDGRTLTAAPAPTRPVVRAGHWPARIAAALGGALAAAGTWLPWLAAGPAHVNGWDIRLWEVIKDEPADAGPWVAVPVVVAGLAVLALALRLPAWLVLVLGLCAALPCVLFLVRFLSDDRAGPVHLSIGPIAGLLGGLTLVGAAVLGRTTDRRWT